MPLAAKNIDEVIDIMDDILEDAMQNNSRLGYFAALYRTVTIIVRDECELGLFEDNERMKRLDTIFANRYFAAYECYQKQIGMPSEAWTASFEVINKREMLILQHLLLGMHAHIALDLGIATAEVAEGHLSDSLKRDFYRLNHILKTLTDVVQDEIAEASPLIRYLDTYAGRLDETFISYGMSLARYNALDFAEELVSLPPAHWEGAIRARDNQVAKMSRRFIARTQFPLRFLVWLVNLREKKNARDVIAIMSDDMWQSTVAQRVEDFVAAATEQDVDLSEREATSIRLSNQLKSP